MKHLYPEARVVLGLWLAEKRLATAMMDLSDGLSSDLPRLCAASDVGARMESAKIPRVPCSALEPTRGLDPLQLALHGGDDYELLFTAAPHNARVMPKSFRGTDLTAIGKITEKQKLVLLEENGRERRLVPGGWDPFRTRR
jgi:thiamine-monophosphate kinase